MSNLHPCSPLDFIVTRCTSLQFNTCGTLPWAARILGRIRCGKSTIPIHHFVWLVYRFALRHPKLFLARLYCGFKGSWSTYPRVVPCMQQFLPASTFARDDGQPREAQTKTGRPDSKVFVSNCAVAVRPPIADVGRSLYCLLPSVSQ